MRYINGEPEGHQIDDFEIIDNFLKDDEFDHVIRYSYIDPLSNQLIWSKTEKVFGDDSKYNFQYVHNLYDDYTPRSPLFNALEFILRKLSVLSVYRVKMNKEPLCPERYYSDFHYDYNCSFGTHEKPIGHSHMKTGILYLNTNDGYTEFENGKTVKSVANRFIEFPANTKHRGVSQTDTDLRYVINFNYFIE
tara:strand:+ start:207 stop:782 length:576 start_codon:yes stop_codon:yes gene_type:complete